MVTDQARSQLNDTLCNPHYTTPIFMLQLELGYSESAHVLSHSLPPVSIYLNNGNPVTFVTRRGYDLFTFLRPSSIFGSSDGFTGSTAILTTDWVLNLRGLKI